MRSITKILGIVGLIAAIIVAIWVTRSGKQEAEIPAQPETAPNAQATPTESHHSLSSPQQNQSSSAATSEVPHEVVATETNAVANWEEKIDEVLRDNAEPEDKAKRLLAVFPDLPEEGQVEAAQHIANLIADEDYPQLARYLVDPGTSSDVIDVLMTDLLNRPDSVKLPTLLQIAQKPQHPDAAEARDILELYLEEDYGNDWGKWEQKLGEWLKDNPD